MKVENNWFEWAQEQTMRVFLIGPSLEGSGKAAFHIICDWVSHLERFYKKVKIYTLDKPGFDSEIFDLLAESGKRVESYTSLGENNIWAVADWVNDLRKNSMKNYSPTFAVWVAYNKGSYSIPRFLSLLDYGPDRFILLDRKFVFSDDNKSGREVVEIAGVV